LLIFVFALNVVFVFIGTEAVLRIMERQLPYAIVELLTKSARTQILERRGLFVRDNLVGEDMLYHWEPEAVINELPWVKIDSNGYRNAHEAKSQIDVVLLGDSVTIAQNSRKDMAALLNEKDLTTLNLGFSSYGPLHYRDPYKKTVLDANIAARVVVINFCYCNDVTDAQSYERLKKIGKNWTDYLGTTPVRNAFPFDFEPPWIISILFNAPYKIVQNFRNKQNGNARMKIELPRTLVDIPLAGWSRTPKLFSDRQWAPAIQGLLETIKLAQVEGTHVILAYYPNLSQIYMKYITPSNPFSAAAHQEYNDAIFRLRSVADQSGNDFVDYTPAIQRAHGDQMVSTHDGDYHPNEYGVKVMVDTIYPIIKKNL